MTAPPYTADPVETIIRALARGIGPDKARAMFLEGVELNWIRRAVVNMGAGDDPYRILRAAFKTGRVTLVPNIGPIRDVRERRGLDRWDFGGVYLYTDHEKVVADLHLLRLLPSAPGEAPAPAPPPASPKKRRQRRAPTAAKIRRVLEDLGRKHCREAGEKALWAEARGLLGSQSEEPTTTFGDVLAEFLRGNSAP